MPMFKAVAALWTMHEGKAVDKSIEKFQLREMHGAMRAFLKAALKRIPVRTGFLRGAFRPYVQQFMKGQAGADLNPALAELFGQDPELSKSRFKNADRYNDNVKDPDRKPMSDWQRQRFEKNRALKERQNLRRWRKTKAGRMAGRDHRLQEWYYYGKKQRILKTPSNALKFIEPKDPSEVIKTSGMTSTLQFDIQISYLRINDFYTRITGSPWRSFDAGFQAMLNYMENAARRYPFLSEVLTTQRIYLKGSKVGKEEGNIAADYRRRFGSSFHDTAGAIRGAKMDAYPGSDTKPAIGEFPNNEDVAMIRRLLYYNS